MKQFPDINFVKPPARREEITVTLTGREATSIYRKRCFLDRLDLFCLHFVDYPDVVLVLALGDVGDACAHACRTSVKSSAGGVE